MKEKTIFALGFFDGVHLGHQALLSACKALAEQAGCRAGALTFDLPPEALLKNSTPNMITSAQDRVRLLQHYGMEQVQILPANKETLSMCHEAFLQQLLSWKAAGFVCGEDYRFGRGGLGNPQILADFAQKQGLPIKIVPQQQLDEKKISSTRIRKLLEQGDVENANRLLGHPYLLSGTVVAGKQLGRTIGIPTANLILPAELLTPALGVYACKVWVEGQPYLAVTNIGNRPTVEGTGVTVEAWILDFEGDLYGKTVTLELHKFLRPEQKFQSLTALQAEIRKNGEETRKFFKK